MFPMIRTYQEMLQYSTFEDRFNYLKLSGLVGKETFGYDRYLNQKFYTSKEWLKTRDKVIVRDKGCDLAIEGREIIDRIIVHHINPITVKDLIARPEYCLDMNNLVCVSHNTHEAISYGDESLLIPDSLIERKPNDTIPWRK